MDKTKLEELIRSFDNELDVKEGKQFVEVSVPPQKFYDLARRLKEHENTYFDFLFCLTGVDYGTDLGVIYHLRSTRYGHSIVLKTRTNDRGNPEIQSVVDLWKTAEYHEREVFDLLGIKFTGHPDLRRFFLEKSAGYPLRKDFIDDINVVTR